MKYFSFWICFLFSTYLLSVPYDYTEDHKTAYRLIMSLRFEEGKEVIQEIKNRNKEDILIYHIENYIDFLTVFINEDKTEFKEREKNKEHRLDLLKKGDKESPYYLFSQAEIHLHWALSRLKFEEYITAALEVNKAIGLLEKNQKLFPDFVSNKKSLSILHAISGTIPDQFKGIINLISNFEGTIEDGLNEINEVLEDTKGTDYIFWEEALAIKSLILLYLKSDSEKSWNFIKEQKLDVKNVPILTFLVANTALKAGRNDEAIDLLINRKRSPKIFTMHYLDLMLGGAKLSRGDRDANIYIQSYLTNFKGQNYIKDAYRKLAWYEATVKSNTEGYYAYMEKCKKEGDKVVEEDKSAYKEAVERKKLNINLLEARILFDGGYGKKASEVLRRIDVGILDQNEKIEYYYRKARVYELLSNVEKSIMNYKTCLDLGENSDLYYACNSALLLGNIFEKKGMKSKAKNYYKKCLKMRPSEYRNGIHQKAKSGLNRLKKA